MPHTTDYLVIGSGIASLTFALDLAERVTDANVTVITKRKAADANGVVEYSPGSQVGAEGEGLRRSNAPTSCCARLQLVVPQRGAENTSLGGTGQQFSSGQWDARWSFEKSSVGPPGCQRLVELPLSRLKYCCRS